MTKHRDAPPPAQHHSIRPVDVWLGVLFFGVGNFIVVFLLFFTAYPAPFGALPGVIYGLLVLGFAAFAYFTLGWRGFAVGIVLGFVLMTVVTGGTCTLFVDLEDDPIIFFPAIYIVVVLAGGIAVGIYEAVRARR